MKDPVFSRSRRRTRTSAARLSPDASPGRTVPGRAGDSARGHVAARVIGAALNRVLGPLDQVPVGVPSPRRTASWMPSGTSVSAARMIQFAVVLYLAVCEFAALSAGAAVTLAFGLPVLGVAWLLTVFAAAICAALRVRTLLPIALRLLERAFPDPAP